MYRFLKIVEQLAFGLCHLRELRGEERKKSFKNREQQMDLELRFWIVNLVTRALLPAVYILIGVIAIIDKTRELGKRLKVWKYYKRSKVEKESSAQEDMSVEEYVNGCIPVTREDIARDPEEYIGKDIIIEGNLLTVVDTIVIGLRDGYPINVNYDGKAYDKEGTIIGDVMDDDYVYAAGIFRGDGDITGIPYMDVAIVILKNGH